MSTYYVLVKYMTEKEIIAFSETGIGNQKDTKERIALAAGKEYLIEEIRFVDSDKYGGIAHIEGASNFFNEGSSFYTTSKVLCSQLYKLLERYGNGEEGELSSVVSVRVEERVSEKGRRYLSFA